MPSSAFWMYLHVFLTGLKLKFFEGGDVYVMQLYFSSMKRKLDTGLKW